MQIDKFELGNYMYIPQLEEVEATYNISDEEILGLAYLKKKRDDLITRKFSWLVAFDGRHRSGKSVSAIMIAIMFDKTFWRNFESRIVHTPEQVLEQFEIIADNDIHGACVIIDEAGASLAGSDWYEKVQKSILKTVQIFGRYNPCIFMVSPVKELISGGMRKMFHSYFKIDRYDNERSYITPYETYYSGIRGKYMNKKPQLTILGQKITLSRIAITKPPEEILTRYAELEKGRKEMLMKEFRLDVQIGELKKQRDVVDDDAQIEYIMKNQKIFASPRWKPNDPMFDPDVIKNRLHVPLSKAKYYKLTAERKIRSKLDQIEKETELKTEEKKEKDIKKAKNIYKGGIEILR